MTRAMSRSVTVEPLTVTEADISSLAGLPADIETMTDSSCSLAERSARSIAWRMRLLGGLQIDHRAALDAARKVWPKPTTSTVWLRRRSTSCGACGLSRAIRQAILLVPTSSAATSAERFGDTGFALGVRPNWRTVMRALPSWPSCQVLELLLPRLRGLLGQPHRHAVGQAACRSRRYRASAASPRGRASPVARARPATSVSGSRTSSPLRSRRFQRRSPTRIEARTWSRIAGKRSSSARKSLARVSAPRPTTSGSVSSCGATKPSSTVPSSAMTETRRSFCHSANGSRSLISICSWPGKQLAHGGVGDPRIGLEPLARRVDVEEQERRPAGHPGGGQHLLPGQLVMAGDRQIRDAEADRIGGLVARILEERDDRRAHARP